MFAAKLYGRRHAAATITWTAKYWALRNHRTGPMRAPLRGTGEAYRRQRGERVFTELARLCIVTADR